MTTDGQVTPVAPSYSEVIIGIRESHGVWGARAGPAALSQGLGRAAAALDRNEAAARAVRQELARRSYGFTEVRFLGLLVLSVMAAAPAGWRLRRAFRRTNGKAASSGPEHARRLGACLPMT